MSANNNDHPEKPAAPHPVGKEIQDHLGRKLKATYEDLVSQPVPDKFKQLLDELARREKQQ
jgi:hypothetical protein